MSTVNRTTGTTAAFGTNTTQPPGLATEATKLNREATVLNELNGIVSMEAAATETPQQIADRLLADKMKNFAQYAQEMMGESAKGLEPHLKQKVSEFLAQNPNATAEQIQKVIDDEFNNKTFGAYIVNSAIQSEANKLISKLMAPSEEE